jgi:riboflavin kinase / FMN adenylyltransferase
MELIRGTSHLRDSHRGCVVTIGTFDGLHVGHQTLIRRTVQRASELGRGAMLLTFEPTPREYLTPDTAPARLTTLRERCRTLGRMAGAGLALDALCVLRFDERLRSLTGSQFADILARDLRASGVVVGHDFRFGHGAAASAQSLRQAGPGLGFQVEVLDPIVVDGERVSSSGVRAALADSDFARAATWLGRPYSMFGRVVAGERLGRRLGFPTANIRPGRRRAALAGIFAVRVHGAGRDARPGVASLGTRPTVDGVEPLLEAHVFDFDGDLYGRELEVEFVAKLRDEQRFESLDALVAQMHRDAQAARRALE